MPRHGNSGSTNSSRASQSRSRLLLLPCSLLWLSVLPHSQGLPSALAAELQGFWDDHRSLNESDIKQLRQDAWNMFDNGFTNYMALAFPKDNLQPISCSGVNWQGGMAVTLLDSLDSLMMMGRLSDMRAVLPMIKEHVNFKKPIKVHVFEVVIRVVGGLLSGHSLLTRARDTVPEYDGSLLTLASQLAEAMMPAFSTPSGLPWQFTNLKTGPVTDTRVTCTACVGTLLLEYGTLSALQGDPRWRHLAEHAAHLLFERRSSLGLVGSSLDVGTSSWVSREATIGPGSDSFYEYMLKSYLMFGNRTHLDMFAELYTSAMRHLQMPGTLKGYAFLADVHMDSGRMSRPFVSSLGAFWPGMQALIGQHDDAVDLHANFTAAWQQWGWLPELFGLDLTRVHPEDPGYNLRPEHIESTFMLHALTGKPVYRRVAARMQRTLQAANKAACGYASVSNVETGVQVDLQESFFLSETVKYLYLSFTPSAQHLIDYYVLSTEGHILPTFPPNDSWREASEARDLEEVMAGDGPPQNCAKLCEPIKEEEQAAVEAGLRQAFPLLSFRREDAVAIKRRRCIACARVTQHMAAHPAASVSARARIMQLNADLQSHGTLAPNKPLAQVVCVIRVSPRTGAFSCQVLRPLLQHDMTHGLPHNAVVLQLTWVVSTAPTGLLLVTPLTPQDKVSLILPAGTATFGGSLLEITPNCLRHLYNVTWPWTAYATNAAKGRLCPRAAGARDPGGKGALWRHRMKHYPATCSKPTLEQLTMSATELAMQVLVAQNGTFCVAKQEVATTKGRTLMPGERAAHTHPTPTPPAATNTGTQPHDPTDPHPTASSTATQPQDPADPVSSTAARTRDSTTSDPQADTGPGLGEAEQPLECDPNDMTKTWESVTDAHLWSEAEQQASEGACKDPHQDPQAAGAEAGAHSHDRHQCGGDALQEQPGPGEPGEPPSAGVSKEQAAESLLATMSAQLLQNTRDHQLPDRRLESAEKLLATSWLGAELRAKLTDWVEKHKIKLGQPQQQQQQQRGEACVPDEDVYKAEDAHVTGPCKHVPVTYGELVLSSPLDACTKDLSNAPYTMLGMIAVVIRGGCSFAAKAHAAQRAGAAALVVLNMQGRDDELVTMSGDVEMTAATIRIPCLMLAPKHSRILLQAMLDTAQAQDPKLIATLSLDHVQPGGGVPGHDGVSPARGTTSVYMLVPTNSHAFVKANMLERGYDLQASLDSLLLDERVMLMLMQIAKENEAREIDAATEARTEAQEEAA